MQIQRSYKFRFYPNAEQRRQLAVEFGCARFVWNAALDARGLAYRMLGRSENYVGLNKAITELKRDADYAWLKNATSAVLTQSLIDQDKAFSNFFAGRASYPTFKKKLHSQSVRYQLDQRQIARTFNAGLKLLKLPKLGALKLRWSRPVPGVPKMVTVSRDSVGSYFVSFACEIDIQPRPLKTNSVGIDVGLTDVVTLSDGWKSGNPRRIRQYQRALKLAQRVMSRRKKGSGRWHRARIRVAKIQRRIADCRRDFLHKLSRRIVDDYGVICMEDLNVAALCRALRLGKSMADAALGELVRQIEYKAAWAGRQVVKIGRYQRSTGVCPVCDRVGPKLPLAVRTWTCAGCGAKHDRDVAAAQSIEKTAVGICTVDARGAGLIPVAATA